MKRTVRIAPYGYQLAGLGLAPEPREQEVIAIVRDGRARGVSYPKLAAELRARGFTTRTGRPFGTSAVYAIARTWEAAEAPQEGRAA